MVKSIRARRAIIEFLKNGNQPFDEILKHLNKRLKKHGTVQQSLGIILYKMPEVERKGDCGREDAHYYRGQSVQGLWGLVDDC